MLLFSRFSAMLCLAAAGLGGGAASAGDLFRPLGTGEAALDPYRWENRPVILFSPSAQDDTYRNAVTALDAARAALRDRDIIVLSDVTPDNPSALRQRLEPKGFLMLLVGKDGGIKLRSEEAIPVETLKQTIDAMPMRQREMRQD